MLILRPVVHQQQQTCRGDAVDQDVEKRLGLGVEPVQVLTDEEQRLVETFAQQQALEGVIGASAPHLRVHLQEGGSRLGNPQQRKEATAGCLPDVDRA